VAVGGSDPRHEEHLRLPERMAVLEPGSGLGAVSGAAGDAWVDERWAQQILRLDGRDGRVLARIPVDGRVSMSAGAGALWALQSGGGYSRSLHGPLLRIDPATNRVAARIRVRTPADERVVGFGVVAARDAVWIWGPRDLLRVEPRSNRVVQAIAVGDDRGELTGLALAGRTPLATTADGHLLRFDPATGAELAAIPLRLPGPAVRRAGAGRLLVTARGSVAAVDPGSGRVGWRTRLGFRVGTVLESHGLVWVHGGNTHDAGDRLWALDAHTGAVRGSLRLPAFGTFGMAAVDGGLWITSAAGHVVVVPAETPHGFESAADDPLRIVSVHPSPRVQQTWL
jgi:outer membrane protein assembly factor BamB